MSSPQRANEAQQVVTACAGPSQRAVAVQMTPVKSVADACLLLSLICPSQMHQPGTPGYEHARASFWNQTQAEAVPAGIFQPETAAQVSLAIVVCRHTSCPFAVKSGGHGKWCGESSINGGLLIDLARMKQIQLSKHQSTVAVGPGNRWSDVYAALEPLGITVVGGRASGVGVGGFLLGGGISWYSNLYGWGCDNVRSYEVVLRDGTIVTASKDSHRDLYKCLRGGAGNFGVVTSFELETYPYTGMWGGRKAFEYQHGQAAMQAFIDTGLISDGEDPKSFFILGLATTDEKAWVWGASLAYCDAVHTSPVCFKAIDAIPSVADDCALRDQTECVARMQESYPPWLQHCLWAFATQVDLPTLQICCRIWQEEMQSLVDQLDWFKPVLAIQYTTEAVVEGAARNGGNILGLSSTRPFIMYNAEPRWRHARDNLRVSKAIDKAFERMHAEAQRRGTSHEYRYSNYASEYQDPLRSYGPDANEILRDVSRRYDPDSVFQTLRTSGFNLSGAPRGDLRRE
ncbi:uncharacterized protein PV07_08831 [Cladophialophora immunda]|uniref:FAD-binding PCMH-type domain-containing protein n=1 Tax=Cladophialophora immunda TaxID=569365 RepID=A0A0D2C5C0_9EURO|nr:uncharacterized protein PV07_08831 [Cladophialophora immunda]KIW25670.1 hypothetical protein PV07_08831 [Cladophialophora immunda]